MDLDATLQRYLSNQNVSNWLFSTTPLTTVPSQSLSSSFVYAIGFGHHPAPRTMNVEDMLIFTAMYDTFATGVVWGLNQPHIFARTPMMLDKKPTARRFAVDLSIRDALEFLEFVHFDDGMLVIAFRRFLHTRDGALPVVVSARLHAPSPVPGVLGPVRMRAEAFEAACCPNCGQSGRECKCDFGTSPPTSIVTKNTHSWNQFTGMFMRKANHGTIRLRMFGYLEGLGECKVYDDYVPVLNVLQKGDTEYCNVLRRKAVQGMGVNVVMPRLESLMLPFADEVDFVNLHNSYVAKKRSRDVEQVSVQDEERFVDHKQILNYQQADQVNISNPNELLTTTPVFTTESLESVEDPANLLGSFFASEDSPNVSIGLPRKSTPTLQNTPTAFTTQTSESPNVSPQSLLDQNILAALQQQEQQEQTPILPSSSEILRHIEVILSPQQTDNNHGIPHISAQNPYVTAMQPATNMGQYTSSASSEDSMHAPKGVHMNNNALIAEMPIQEMKPKVSTKRVKPASQQPASDVDDADKKHACKQCSSKFKMKGDLIRHVKIVHQGKKMYTCDSCGKAFGHSGHLNRHISSVHLQQRRFGCQFCGFHFYQASHLQSHIKHIHSAKKKFECKQCGIYLNDQYDLDMHLTNAQCAPRKTRRKNNKPTTNVLPELVGDDLTNNASQIQQYNNNNINLGDSLGYSIPQLKLQPT